MKRIAGDVRELKDSFASVDTGDRRGFAKWHYRFLQALKHLAKEHAQPLQVFWAIVVGTIVGTTPLLGFHLLISIVLAMVFRLNKFIVYLAANISLPPLIPVLAFLSIQTAHVIRHGNFMAMDYQTIHEHRFDFVIYWLFGAVPVGAVLGAVVGAVYLVWVKMKNGRLREGLTP